MSTIRLAGRNLPCAGGGYFRLLPYPVYRLALQRLNREGRPGIFYFHPWEIDPGQPRVAGCPALSRFRHYVNLSEMPGRVEHLLRDFAWDRLDRVFADLLDFAAHGSGALSTPMGLVCRALDEATAPAWDAFVRATPGGTFFHLAAWREVIARAFGHRTYYVLTERDGAITGVLPLAHVKTRLFGNSLISNPFCVYGGPLASDGESAAALHEYAEGLMSRLGTSAAEFRFLDPVESEWLAGPDLYVTFRKRIAPDDAANMKAIPRKQRAMVRKGMQNGLTSVVSTEQVDQFHCIYAESVRNLGTPVFSRAYFRLLVATFRDCCDIVTVLDDGEPIAAVLNFYFRDQVLPYYGGGKAVARARAGNDFMYWEVMRRASARGFRLFDFGRSKLGTGACAFKQNWGFSPEKLHYRYKLRPGAAIPDHNPLNPKYRLMIAAWKRLPLPLAGLIGPRIVRGIG